jgi:hypothetical protein
MAVGHLQSLAPLADAMFAAAEWAALVARNNLRSRKRGRNGQAVHPGPGTPLWNELARAVQKHLRRRGDKARLARAIGVPRQRLHLLIVAKTACPDAEQTLRLLAWLSAQQRVIDPRQP